MYRIEYRVHTHVPDILSDDTCNCFLRDFPLGPPFLLLATFFVVFFVGAEFVWTFNFTKHGTCVFAICSVLGTRYVILHQCLLFVKGLLLQTASWLTAVGGLALCGRFPLFLPCFANVFVLSERRVNLLFSIGCVTAAAVAMDGLNARHDAPWIRSISLHKPQISCRFNQLRFGSAQFFFLV